LAAWRAGGVDRRRVWGPRGPERGDTSADSAAALPPAPSLVAAALQALNTADPLAKCGAVHRAWAEYSAGRLPLGLPSSPQQQQQQQHFQQQQPPDRPARPARPRLVAPKHVPSPKDSGLPLSAHVLHNLAHVELNAVDLACDTVARCARACG
jgi:uncharacterized ferritin-like protein (DUF455 family)